MTDATLPNYWDYLKLDQLLDLQQGLEGDEARLRPDELHFIIVHQVIELWFKLIIRELRLARDHLAAPKVPEEQIPYVVLHLRRATEIFRLLVDHFRVIETLTPQDFLAFRDKLFPASGFQSFQMREIELLLGLDDGLRLVYGGGDPLVHIRHLAERSPQGPALVARLQAIQEEGTLRQALHEWLYRTPIQGSSPDSRGDARAVETFLEEYLAAFRANQQGHEARLVEGGGEGLEAVRARFAEADRKAREFLYAEDALGAERPRVRRVRAGLLFIESYRELPLLAWPRLLVDTIVELEQQMVVWRGRHARMAERIIGRRVGTAGSEGVEYLEQTSRYRVFTELWAVRTILLPPDVLPPLQRREVYGFAVEEEDRDRPPTKPGGRGKSKRKTGHA